MINPTFCMGELKDRTKIRVDKKTGILKICSNTISIR